MDANMIKGWQENAGMGVRINMDGWMDDGWMDGFIVKKRNSFSVVFWRSVYL